MGMEKLSRVRTLLRHISEGFSVIIAPHGTGTTVTLNIPGRVATAIMVVLVILLAGLAFISITYGRLATLAVKVEQLRAENAKLREEQRKLDEIKREIARIEKMRRQIEVWAGIATEPPKQVAQVSSPVIESVEPNTWPRKYTYAILKPFYEGHYLAARGMIAPVEGFLSRTFSVDAEGGALHPGVDIAVPTGTPVRCACDGVVTFAGWDDIYGNLVIVDHGDSLMTVYGHNEKLLVKEGDHVTAGQVIATVGNTGRSTAPHLHFGVVKNGNPVDPLKFVSFELE